jgi:Uncharacterized protein conserved in bacteria (DUF2255)
MRSVPASRNVRRAVVRWDQLRRQHASEARAQAADDHDPLFVTIGVRRDGTLRTPRPIWVVRAGDELYVRAAYGPEVAGIGPTTR